jgi:hypothetical protein
VNNIMGLDACFFLHHNSPNWPWFLPLKSLKIFRNDFALDFTLIRKTSGLQACASPTFFNLHPTTESSLSLACLPNCCFEGEGSLCLYPFLPTRCLDWCIIPIPFCLLFAPNKEYHEDEPPTQRCPLERVSLSQ